MARRLRVQYEGAVYHLTVRGVERRRLFDDDQDRERFLKRLEEGVEEHGVRLYLFCLMANHVHLLAETPQANVSVFMHKVQTAYTVYYNLRHRRCGHLMQGRFGAKPVQGDEYLLKLSRYIHLNPVFVGAMTGAPLAQRRKALREYRWSSYRGYAGLGHAFRWICEGPILSQMTGSQRRQRAAYRQFVEAGLAETDGEFLDVLRAATWGIGEQQFQDRIRDAHTDMATRVRRPEDVAFRRAGRRVEPEAVLEAVAKTFGEEPERLRQRRYNCLARAVAAHLLGRHAGLNQRDIGAWLAMRTGAAVSAQLARFRARLATDAELTKRIGGLSEAIARADAGPHHG